MKKNKRGCYLELTIKSNACAIRVNGQEMTGHLKRLKYLQGDMYKVADIRNGKVRIPLEACNFQNFDHGVLRGNLAITRVLFRGRGTYAGNTARLVLLFKM